MSDTDIWPLAKIRVSWEILVKFPPSNTKEQTEFFLNDSSACSSRYIEQLAEEEVRADDDCCFSCHRFSGEFLGWATPEEIEDLTPPKPRKQS